MKNSGAKEVSRRSHIYGQYWTLVRACNKLNVGFAIINNYGVVLKSNKNFKIFFGNRRSIINSPNFLEMLNVSQTGLLKLLASEKLAHSSNLVAIGPHSGQPITYFKFNLVRMSRHQILCEVEDITEDKKEELSWQRTQRKFIDAGRNILGVAHTLKGGSTVLKNILDLLRSSPTLDAFTRQLPSLIRVGHRISNVISELLKTSAKRELEFTEVDLYSLLEEIAALPDISSPLREENIELTISGSCSPIIGAKEDLREAVVCLVDNAREAILERGGAERRISIKIEENDRCDTPGVLLIIEDTGCGIPPEKISACFQPFYTNKRGGSGLGLTIAQKAFEEVHGGQIFVESQVEKGTTFRISLPHKPLEEALTKKPLGVTEKIHYVRERIASLEGIDLQLVNGCINSMTLRHVRDRSADELFDQIIGQINQLQEYLETNRPHFSINNSSRHTEAVLAAHKDCTRRHYWLNLITYELQRLGISEPFNVIATRNIEAQRAVCRIFEIRKYKGGKLTEEERAHLEQALLEKFTPLPSLEEFDAQDKFLKDAEHLLQENARAGAVLSLILNPSFTEPDILRLADFKSRFFPSERELEEALSRRYMLTRTSPSQAFAPFIASVQSSQDILIINGQLADIYKRFKPFDPFIINLSLAFNINSFLAAIFPNRLGGVVVNLLCSDSLQNFPSSVETSFQIFNKKWIRAVS